MVAKPLRKFIVPWEAHPDRDQEWYDGLKYQMTIDEIHREVDRGYSPSLVGRVFSSFNERLHLSSEPLPFNPHIAVYRIWDFGGVNACLWGQIDNYGRRRLLHELVLGRLENASNTPEQIDAVLADSQRLFKGAEFIDICDPAGSYKDHRTGAEEKRTDVEQMEQRNLKPQYATIVGIPTIERKKRSRDLFIHDLEKFRSGEPGFMLYANKHTKAGCVTLLEALQGGYRYKRDNQGNFRDTIVEEHPFEDVVDCLLYWYLETTNKTSSEDYSSYKPTPYGGAVNPYTGV